MKRTLLRTSIFLLFVVTFFGAAVKFAPDIIAKISYATEYGQAQAAREQLKNNPVATAVDFRPVVKAIAPSVVNISTVTNISLQAPTLKPEVFRDPWNGFFGDHFFERFLEAVPRQNHSKERSLGTGVIVSDDGYVLTNNHVIRGADEVEVNLSDGRNLKATVIGTDTKTDLAVLKVDGSNLLPAELSATEEVEVGEWVLAVGNPFGLRNTFTSGIVSAKGRSDMGIAQYEDFIQTDAAINPGNSGGPLVDMRGRVIGINTAIASKSGGYQGIGFAIPSAMAREVMDDLIKNGRVVRGWLGVYIQDLNEDLAESFAYENAKGVLLADVIGDGPAAKAGLEGGDIVEALNGVAVKDTKSLSSAVAKLKPGSDAKVTVFRNGERKTMTVKIASIPNEEAVARESSVNKLGLKLKTLTPEVAQKANIKATEGAFVTMVTPRSMADRAGLRHGDVIRSVNGIQIESASDFDEVIQDIDLGKGIRLLVESKGHRRFVFLRAEGRG